MPRNGVKAAFENQIVSIPLSIITPQKVISKSERNGNVYRTIEASIKEIGLIEPLVVYPQGPGNFLLLEGHVRFEILKSLGMTEAKCLLSRDDECYTYNRHVNYIPPVAQHFMLLEGIKVRYIYYWSNFFNDPELEGRQVPIRYDPFDTGIAYAFVRKQWVECKSEHYAIFEGRSEREIMLATEELRRKHQQHSGKRFGVNAATLAKFFDSVEVSEAVLEQSAMDRELHAAMHGIPMVSDIQCHNVSVDSVVHDEAPKRRVLRPQRIILTHRGVGGSTQKPDSYSESSRTNNVAISAPSR